MFDGLIAGPIVMINLEAELMMADSGDADDQGVFFIGITFLQLGVAVDVDDIGITATRKVEK